MVCQSSPGLYRGEVSASFRTSILFVVLDSIAIIVLGNPAPAILFGSMSEALDLTPTRLDAIQAIMNGWLKKLQPAAVCTKPTPIASQGPTEGEIECTFAVGHTRKPHLHSLSL